jgi:hypothetical protein
MSTVSPESRKGPAPTAMAGMASDKGWRGGAGGKTSLVGVTAGAGILAFLFALMTFMTWLCWADILVDFGEELYVPWQMLSGKALYRDISYLFGPISSYFNMALFSVFGASFRTLYIANLALFGLFLAGLYRLLARATSSANAFIAAGIVISIFGFAQYVPASNYNFISPYRHTATHGLFLSLLLLWWLALWHEKRDSCLRAGIAGACFGCALLTRTEIGVAAAAMVAACLVLMAVRRDGTKKFRRSGSLFALSACLPALGFLAVFASKMPMKDALKAIASPWTILLTSGATRGEFYRWGMGTDAPVRNALLVLGSGAIAITGLAVLRVGSHYATKRGTPPAQRAFCALAVVGVIGLALLVTPYNAAQGFPLLCAAALALLARSWWKDSRSSDRRARETVLLLLSIFSLALLAKTLLFCRLYHYGFYLSLPAAVLLCSMAFWFIPQRCGASLGGRRVYQTALVLFMGIVCARCILITKSYSDAKAFRVGHGADAMLTYAPNLDDRGYLVAEAVDWIAGNTEPGSTLTVIPEGITINYWTRRASPIPVTNFMLPELQTFGEESILAAFQSSPPDYILVVHKDTAEYGVGYFGQDVRYGFRIMGWVREHYQAVWRIGGEPLTSERFGILLLERKNRDKPG